MHKIIVWIRKNLPTQKVVHENMIKRYNGAGAKHYALLLPGLTHETIPKILVAE